MKTKCVNDGKCFAKSHGYCRILLEEYEKKNSCPFQKPIREVTKGKEYPVNRFYYQTNN